MLKLFQIAGALVLAVLLPLSSCGSPSSGGSSETVQAAEEKAEQRQPAPDFTLETAEGEAVQLSEFKEKVVLLNFWATWCGPCKIEMPWFVEFQRKYKDQGFTVLAVSLDEEGWEVVKPFTDELDLNFPVVVGTDKLADKFGGVIALPTTFFIDKEGRIAGKHTGLVSKSDYEEQIESLL